MTTRFYLVPMLTVSVAMLLLPCAPSWRVYGHHLYLYPSLCISFFNIKQLTWRWLRDTPIQGSPMIYSPCSPARVLPWSTVPAPQPGFSHDLQSLPPAKVLPWSKVPAPSQCSPMIYSPCPQSAFSHAKSMKPNGHVAGWRGTISKFWNR
jgi:hypothetical protein